MHRNQDRRFHNRNRVVELMTHPGLIPPEGEQRRGRGPGAAGSGNGCCASTEDEEGGVVAKDPDAGCGCGLDVFSLDSGRRAELSMLCSGAFLRMVAEKRRVLRSLHS